MSIKKAFLSKYLLLGILILAMLIPVAVIIEDVQAARECDYTLLNVLLTPLANRRATELPYSFADAMYIEGSWWLPADWDHSQNVLIAYIVDWCHEQIQEFWVNTGQYYVVIWDTWEAGEDGYPRPAGAYWIAEKEAGQ